MHRNVLLEEKTVKKIVNAICLQLLFAKINVIALF